jgi:hypothetical protein
LPSVVRVQTCISVVVLIAHAPEPHLYALHERLCMPVSSQVSENPPHVPHAVQMLAPQLVPSVSRAQLLVSVRSPLKHAPLPQK